MTKPTLVQSILNLPSQTYSSSHIVDDNNSHVHSHNHANNTRPVKKDYYSTKQEMIRIAASMVQAERADPPPNGSERVPVAPAVTRRPEAIIHPSSSKPHHHSRPPQPPPKARSYEDNEDEDEDNSDLDAFFTPNTSPRTSMASSAATVKFPTSRKPSRRSLTNVSGSDLHQPLYVPDTAEHPVPKASGGSSSAGATTSAAVPSTRTPSISSSRARHVLSSSSSFSSNSLEAHSVFSDDVGSAESTLLTSPHQSDSSQSKAQGQTAKSTTTNSKRRSGNATDQGRKALSPTSSSNAPNSYQPRPSAFPTSASSPSISPGQNLDKTVASGSTPTPKRNTSISSQPPKSTSTSATATPPIPSSTKGKEKEKEKYDEVKDTTGYGTVTILPSNTPSRDKKYVPQKQPHTFSAFASVSSPSPSSETSASATTTGTPTHSRSSSASAAQGVINGYVTSKGTANGATTQSSQSHRSSAGTPTANGSTSSASAQKSARHTSAPPAPTSSKSASASKPLPSSSANKARPASDAHANTKTTPHTSSSTSTPTSTPSNTPPSTQRKKPTIPKPPPSGMIGMDALMEEDEEGPLTPRMESKELFDSPGGGGGGKRSGGWDWDRLAGEGGSGSGTSTPPSGSGSSRPGRGLRHTSPHASDLRRRRSRSLDTGDSSSSASSEGTTRRSNPKSTSTRPPPQTLSAEVQALVSDFVSPADQRPSKGTQGYTSLVLPRAPPPQPSASSKVGKKSKGEGWLGFGGLGPDGKIDLTKTGVAKTTMASVEVVRGLGSSGGGGILGGLLGFGRRRAFSAGERDKGGHGPLPIPIPQKARGAKENGTATSTAPTSSAGAGFSGGGGGTGTTILGFTSYRKPPNYVPSGSVLVQVWAVGVDGVDGRLVGVRFGGGGYGHNAGGRGGSGQGGEEGWEEVRHTDLEPEGETENEGEGETEDERVHGHHHSQHEREGAEGGDEEEEDGDEEDLQMQSTPTPMQTPSKKGGLAALGRTLSFRLSRTPPKKQEKEKGNVLRSRSASAAIPAVSSPSKGRQGPDSFEQRPQQRNGHANGNGNGPATPPKPKPNEHKRSLSFSLTLKRNNTAASQATSATTAATAFSSSTTPDNINHGSGTPRKEKGGNSAPTPTQNQAHKLKRLPKQTQAEVGYIPGRSFVGRVLEVGWDVRDEVVRKGEWVVGLLDVRKAGALAEFIIVDRHRVHRVPHPWEGPTSPDAQPASPISPGGKGTPQRMLTSEELALLPLCGLPAYRAVRTFMYAFSSSSRRDGSLPSTPPSSADRRGFDFSVPPTRKGSLSRGTSDHAQGYRRRVLVLRGHDGPGAIAVQMLVRRGWRVSVHVPFSSVPAHATQEVGDRFMQVVEERAREWGADEVIFDDGEEGGGLDDGRGAAVRVLDTLREDGDVFDAVLDTIGGKEVREAGERLLRSNGAGAGMQDGGGRPKRRGVGQFTTLVGDNPERTIPSAGDNFRAGLRSLRPAGGGNTASTGGGTKAHNTSEDQQPPNLARSSSTGGTTRVGYAWVSVAQDVDWEGDDVAETLGMVLRLALEDGVRPLVDDLVSGGGADGQGLLSTPRAVPFERAPAVFVDNGPLRDGGTIVVKIAQ